MPDNEELLQIKGDEKLILTALKNLIENGCKFSTNKQAHVSLQIIEQMIEVKIKNEGKGIPEADIPYIFQPFFRAENTAASKGYGIGLSLVERIVNLHQGSISVQSEQNGWTEFTVKFPVAI
jgi:signal transduction histidine kinase